MPRRDPNPDTNGHTNGNDSAPDAHGYSNGNDSAADAHSNGYSDGDRHSDTAASADSRAQRDAARHAAAATLGGWPNQSSLQALANFASACCFLSAPFKSMFGVPPSGGFGQPTRFPGRVNAARSYLQAGGTSNFARVASNLRGAHPPPWLAVASAEAAGAGFGALAETIF